jgi:alkylation response protein AidB-like acyl-CoA dehydrogenase
MIDRENVFRHRVDDVIAGRACQFDEDRSIPKDVFEAMAAQGWLGALVPQANGGQPLDAPAFGRLCEAFGAQSGSLLSLLTVHSMVCFAVARWGTVAQKAHWLARLATGESLGAFALSETGAGSDAQGGLTSLTPAGDDDQLLLNGCKTWISMGQVATVFLVTAKLNGKIVTVLVPRSTPGVTVNPIRNLSGLRSAMLAEIRFENCRLSRTQLLGSLDFGLAQVVGSVLSVGRLCIAWGGVGMAQSCLEASVSWSKSRVQSGQVIGHHQLIQQMVADMVTRVHAARLVCQDASQLFANQDPQMIMSTMLAKYMASQVANQVAADAVQIHGASGCTDDSPVQRSLRDAKVLTLIEGTSQVLQITIARDALQL